MAGCSRTREPSALETESAAGESTLPPGTAPGRTGAAPPTLAARPPGAATRLSDDDPAKLIGLDEGGLRSLLGQPNFMRRDIPALLWRYAGSGCTLDVFLYRTAAGGPFTVTHVAARSTEGARSLAAPAAGKEINPRVCLGAVLRAHQPQPTAPTG